MQHNRVRSYLDPDTVGPLPRSALADDSDALAAAQTLLRLPDAGTQEICVDDVIEVIDPDRPRAITYHPPSRPHRRNVEWYATGALVAIVIAAVQGLAALRTASPQAARSPRSPVAIPRHAPAPSSSTPLPFLTAPTTTVGTLRVDHSVEGQRVFVDGVALRATAAILWCGPHEVAVGSVARSRSVDVPCGGEVTVFR